MIYIRTLTKLYNPARLISSRKTKLKLTQVV